MKVCKECGVSYQNNQFFCPSDGNILSPDEVLKDTYHLKRLIGAGGLGFVFEAYHERLDTSFAIKVLKPAISLSSPTAGERFIREAKVLASLSHESIIRVSDFDTVDGVSFFVMDLLEGTTLEERIRSKALFDPGQVLEIFAQLGDAISFAHGRNVIHRDLKPANVFLTPGTKERVTVLDFGLAKVLGTKLPDLTETNALLGTPLYMSPEQFTHSSSVDHRTDIYSLGLILYEMFSGRRPFSANNLNDLINMHLNQKPDSLASLGLGVSKEIDEVVQRSLEKDPPSRQQTVAKLIEEISASIETQDSDISEGKDQEQQGAKNVNKTIFKKSKFKEFTINQNIGKHE